MKHKLSILTMILLLCGFLMSSCQKKKDKTVTPSTTSSNQTDQSGSAAADDALDDINDIISNHIGGGSSKARIAAWSLPCGVVSIDSSSTNASNNKIYKVQYGNQTLCGYKKKSGTVSFELTQGKTFADSGAVFTLTFSAFTVEIVATNDIVVLNGTLYISNVNGGYIWEPVVTGKDIQHRLRGSFNITYSNGDIRTRNYYQLRTWSSADTTWAGLTFTVAGDSAVSTYRISETGYTYVGNYYFYTGLTQPFQWSNCGTTYAGPYVLKTGNAQMNVSIPAITTSYFQVQAGYYWDYTTATSTPTLTSSCNSNAYKITMVIDSSTTNKYQLY